MRSDDAAARAAAAATAPPLPPPPEVEKGGKNVQAETGPRFALDQVGRTVGFWTRVTGIYTGYKVTQVRAALARARGVPGDVVDERLWQPRHRKAAGDMYDLCVGLRGFYLKAGQFIGARGDFVPEAWCRKLSLLHDQVPPMPPAQARKVLEAELGHAPLGEVFEWIDLDEPLGSASVSQVHKAKLRGAAPSSTRKKGGSSSGDKKKGALQPADIIISGNSSSSDASSTSGGGVLGGSGGGGGGLHLQDALRPFAHHHHHHHQDVESLPAVAAARAAVARGEPRGGIVAVKVQYPDAEATMKQDMGNLRLAAAFLQRTELKFDLVSAVDELAAQLSLEFDFRREARVMDAVSRHLMSTCKNVAVPRSVPGLVTRRMLVMEFLDGVPITRLEERTRDLPEAVRAKAKKRIMSHVSEAYGRMLLLDGLFQADGHPGNILVMKGGKVGLLDYGQSKKLPDPLRLAFARLVLAINRGDAAEVSGAMWDLGIVTDKDDAPLRRKMATNMFDTRGKIDVFGPDSTLRQSSITTFPKDLFFVLRVTQLLRGMCQGMGLTEFSSAAQWKGWAAEALANDRKGVVPESIEGV